MAPFEDHDFALDPAALEEAVQLLATWAGHFDEPPREEHPLPEMLPEGGMGGRAALEGLAPGAIGGAARLGDPGFFAHMDPPTPWFTWAARLWAAALNQNLLHPDTSPTARPLEARVVSWLAPLFGMSGGHLVPGSTIANLTALWAARELRGVEEVAASEAAHLSVRKSASILGLRYRAVPADADQRLRPELLGDLSHTALVLTAGTVAAGAVDPLYAGEGAAWRHVDAAWAGPLRFSDRYASLLGGVEQADSVAFSAHKWLFQPKECGVVLFADADAAHGALSYGGGYLAAPNVGVLGSHGASALPLAATLLAWGKRGVAERIERCMALADELARLVDEHERLRLFRPPTTGVVLWRVPGKDSRAVRDGLHGARVSLAEAAGQTWLRSVSANPMADPELVVRRVLAAARGDVD